MEDNFKPCVQKQGRLNPKMQEVVKKEVIKLLDTGIIYPIPDSPWVVPKKGGLTVVTSDNNELVPTRTVTGWREQDACLKQAHFDSKAKYSNPQSCLLLLLLLKVLVIKKYLSPSADMEIVDWKDHVNMSCSATFERLLEINLLKHISPSRLRVNFCSDGFVKAPPNILGRTQRSKGLLSNPYISSSLDEDTLKVVRSRKANA
ncbi:hypothetical protein OSB04_020157 [Centaurea solstitialis]|uniref:Reverse transcriptase n=1 Tax=Centaurea solstitialis TaxID=347529 RepID=A0AA38STB2_9ASTR|nr:hypothetical protein OSB04_020157 [Centaurea solstitialis]